MVAYYTILGRQVGSQYLAMATLGSLAAGITYSISGSKASKAQGPPIQASNSAEEAFIKEFLKDAAEQEKKQKQ